MDLIKNSFASSIKTILSLFLIAFLFQTSKAQVEEAVDWSEKIQLYGHGYSIPHDFTATELQYIADHYPIFTVEKRSGYLDYGGNPSTEAATIGTAAKLKKLNPDIKVLLYWNSVMNYESLFESNVEFAAHPEWVHSIWTVGSGAEYEIYDLENIDCQDWWVNSVVDIIERGNLDGIFFDAGPKAEVSGLSEALFTAVDRVRERIGEDKIIIYNGYRVASPNAMQAGPDYIEHSTGVFIELFLNPPLDTKEEAALLFDRLIDAYEAGKIIIPHGSPSSGLPNTVDPFLFTFASFLLFYGPNSYYLYNNGYNKTQGMLDYYPEYYDIATGKSLGNPQRNGWVYTREFENISVRVDLQNGTASITQKYQLSFKVTDATTAANLPDVTLEIDGQSYTTDSLGATSIVLGKNQYAYILSKEGCDSIMQTIDLTKDTTLAIQMSEIPLYTLSFKITDATTDENLSDVTVVVDSQSYTTDILGERSVVLEGADYPYSVSKTGYDSINQSVNLSSDTTIALQMQLLTTNNLQQLKQQVKVYPNPSSEYLHIESPLNLNKINIYDQSGRLIESKELHSRNYRLNTSNYTEGIYLLQIKSDKEQPMLIKFNVAKNKRK